jgi:hypothetical protein
MADTMFTSHYDRIMSLTRRRLDNKPGVIRLRKSRRPGSAQETSR